MIDETAAARLRHQLVDRLREHEAVRSAALGVPAGGLGGGAAGVAGAVPVERLVELPGPAEVGDAQRSAGPAEISAMSDTCR